MLFSFNEIIGQTVTLLLLGSGQNSAKGQELSRSIYYDRLFALSKFPNLTINVDSFDDLKKYIFILNHLRIFEHQ